MEVPPHRPLGGGQRGAPPHPSSPPTSTHSRVPSGAAEGEPRERSGLCSAPRLWVRSEAAEEGSCDEERRGSAPAQALRKVSLAKAVSASRSVYQREEKGCGAMGAPAEQPQARSCGRNDLATSELQKGQAGVAFSLISLPLTEDLATGANRERIIFITLKHQERNFQMELAKPPPLQSEQLLSIINHSIKCSIHHPPAILPSFRKPESVPELTGKTLKQL
ncbi:uncharacterized protein LOC121361735 [Pyrgilauda ruficollis]|uniref:uncharacterized protein LOC121361735 n=1 Tax=Pyrgilauda ruficollis TaxID=221976 RepID=UPI001B861C75|nr:uncharacterized protein LOC121361735 [Pyrgilauda ruficollis]